MDKGLRLVLVHPSRAQPRSGGVGLGLIGSDMTKDRRHKRDARERKERVGESYVAARRNTAGKTRRDQLVGELVELDLDPDDYTDLTDDEISDVIADEQDSLRDAYADAMDTGGWTEDDDSGYGPFSYFAHAMSKDD